MPRDGICCKSDLLVHSSGREPLRLIPTREREASGTREGPYTSLKGSFKGSVGSFEGVLGFFWVDTRKF